MNENEQDIGFEEFEAAFSDENQISDTDEEQETDESAQEPQNNSESGDTNSEGPGDDGDEQGAEEPGKPEDDPETFTLRVNKEERNVSREEVITLAQKGADYDRVKGQLTESREQNQALQERIDKYKNAVESLETISKNVNMSVDDLVDQLHVNMLVKAGKTEAEAKAEIRAIKAEAKLKAVEEAKEPSKKEQEETAAARAEREVAEFHKRFPGVELTKELCDELTEDVRKGMTISDAYQKREISRKDAEIAELTRKLAAEKQNKKNKANTPGSQNDSGGRREKSEFDDFMSAFA